MKEKNVINLDYIQDVYLLNYYLHKDIYLTEKDYRYLRDLMAKIILLLERNIKNDY